MEFRVGFLVLWNVFTKQKQKRTELICNYSQSSIIEWSETCEIFSIVYILLFAAVKLRLFRKKWYQIYLFSTLYNTHVFICMFTQRRREWKINLNLSNKLFPQKNQKREKKKLKKVFFLSLSKVPHCYLNMLEAAAGRLKSLSSCDEQRWIPAIVV